MRKTLNTYQMCVEHTIFLLAEELELFDGAHMCNGVLTGMGWHAEGWRAKLGIAKKI